MNTSLASWKHNRAGKARKTLLVVTAVAICLLGTVADAANILYYSADPLNDARDLSVIDRLTGQTHSVEVKTAITSNTSDAMGKDLIIISSQVLSDDIGTKFQSATIPVIQWEASLWDEFLMSCCIGSAFTTDSIDVINTTHPLAQRMNLSSLNTLQVRNGNTSFLYGGENDQATDITVIANRVGTNIPAIAVVDAGQLLNNGTLASGTRIMLFFGDENLNGVNPAGLDIFDGAVDYALIPATVPSDLNSNGFVDFEDLTILLANWNKDVTADDGNLVEPLTTVVNFADLTVLLADWTGPGPAGSPEAALGTEAVPEPSTLLLALLATPGLSFGWRRRRRA